MAISHLSKKAMSLYGKIARGYTPTDSDKPELGELKALGLIAFDAGGSTVPALLSPKEAGQRLIAAEIAEAAKRVAWMQAVPQMVEALAADYERVRETGGCEYLGTRELVNAKLDDIVARAEFEILAAQPDGPRTPEQLERSLARDSEALRRGVEMRTLYRDTVRDHTVTAEAVRVMSQRGRDYRTLVGPFRRRIIIDRKYAFVPDYTGGGVEPTTPAAWLVTDRAMIAYVRTGFEETWRRATPWHGELRDRRDSSTDQAGGAGVPGVRTTALQRAILRDLVSGYQQHVIAKRMGMGKRTLSDEIATLRDLFRAQTTNQLVYQFGRSPDHDVDDQLDGISSGRPAA